MKSSTIFALAMATLICAAAAPLEAAPSFRSSAEMQGIEGDQGITVPTPSPQSAQQKEIAREFIRRNTVTEYPVERVDLVFERQNTFELGKSSGKTISDLFAEGQPGRLPQFFIDEANRITSEKHPTYPLIPGQP